jgi:hypothetical protein
LVYPDDALMDLHFVEVRQRALEFDAKASTRPMTRKVISPRELTKKPDKITGHKGESSEVPNIFNNLNSTQLQMFFECFDITSAIASGPEAFVTISL